MWNNLSPCQKSVPVLVLPRNVWRQNWRPQLCGAVVRLPACHVASRQRSAYRGPSPAAAASPRGLRGNPWAACSNALIQSHQLHDDAAVLHCELVPAFRNHFSISFRTLFESVWPKGSRGVRICETLLPPPACPCSQVKAGGVTWGILMLIAGFVGDAKLIKPMLDFTGVCRELITYFMNLG